MKFRPQLTLITLLLLTSSYCLSDTYRGVLSGIHCESCKKTVVESLGNLKGVETVGLTPITDTENYWVSVSTKGSASISAEKASAALESSEHYNISGWSKLPVAYMPVLPYEFLMEKLASGLVDIRTIVGEGDDCHDYSPTPKQVTKISKSNLIFYGDLGFEGNFFVKLGDGNKAPKQIDLLGGLKLLEGSCAACEAAKKEGHDHAHNHNHDHDELKDPHVWLSPNMLKQQAQNLTKELKTYLGESAHGELDSNLAALTKELDQVDKELREALAPLKGQKFYVYHGAFAYFAADYGLEQVAIEIGNRKPTPKQLTKIANQAKQDNVKIVFVQPQFDQSSAKALASAIGGEVATLDPLEKDVVANLRKIAAAMKQVQ